MSYDAIFMSNEMKRIEDDIVKYDKILKQRRMLREVYVFLETYGRCLYLDYEGEVKQKLDIVRSLIISDQIGICDKREDLCFMYEIPTKYTESEQDIIYWLLDIIQWNKRACFGIQFVGDKLIYGYKEL